MLSHDEVQELIRRIDSMERPVLSVYIAIDPARPGGDFKSAKLRFKHSLDRLDAPDELIDRLAGMVERPPSTPCTLAGFTDGKETELVQIGILLPVTDPATGDTAVAYGEPLRSPLHDALGRRRYGVALVDEERVRFFEVFAGAIEELWHESRSTVPGEHDELKQSKQVHPAFVPSRGGAAKDNAATHSSEWTRHLYRYAGDQIAATIERRHIDRLLIAGPDGHPRRFASQLPASLGDKVAGVLPSLEHMDAHAGSVLARSRAAIEADRESHLRADLERLEGPEGLGGRDCAAALAAGRLERLILSWQIPRMQLERHLELARARDTEVELVGAELGERLLRTHFGMLGEKRW